MGFQHSSCKGEEDELSLNVAKSSLWQGEIHSSCAALVSEIPKSPGGLLLCESAIVKHCKTTAAKMWQLWGSSHPGGIWEFALERDIPKWKVFFWGCLHSETLLVLKCQCWLTSNNHKEQPKIWIFSCCDATRSRNPWAGFVWELEHQNRHSKEKRKYRRWTQGQSGPCCSFQSFGLKTGIKAI